MIIEIILGVIAIELLALIIVTATHISDARDYIALHIDGLDLRLQLITDFIIPKIKEIEKKKVI